MRLKYRGKDNSEKTPLCIHRAPPGTHERFIGFLIEHYAGNFPLWLAPEQVRVLTLNADDNLIAYAKDLAAEPIKTKIAYAESAKVHTMLVAGGMWKRGM